VSALKQGKVARQLLHNAEYFLATLLPEGELQGVEYSAPNPTRDDENPGSFKINIESGVWSDFATGDSGGDLVELLAYLEGQTNGAGLKAAEAFCREHGLADLRRRPKKSAAKPKRKAKPPAEPVDEAELAELPPDYHSELGPVLAQWTYHDADGKTLFHVQRFETSEVDDGGAEKVAKHTIPIRYTAKGDWHRSKPDGMQPLFNLHKLAEGANVLFGEGEKVAAHLDSFDGFVGTTTGSSDSLLRADLSALLDVGSVDIFPDGDAPGDKYALQVLAYCLIHRVTVRMLDMVELGWCNGEDAADHPELSHAEYEPNLLDVDELLAKYKGFRKKLDTALCTVAAMLEPIDFDRAKERLCELLECSRAAVNAAVKPYRQKEFAGVEAQEEEELEATPEEIAAYRESIEEEIGDLIYREHILDAVSETLGLIGMVGERGITRLTYLAVSSRLLKKPVNVLVKGSSSSGKSYTTQNTLRLFPSEAFYTLSGGSAKSLIYTSEDFQHRTLVILEASTLNGASEDDAYSMFLRTLISEGYIKYETVEKNEFGELEARVIEKQGPTNLILTTTASNIHHENETRMISVYPDESEEQTRAVMGRIANAYAGTDTSAEVEAELERWHKFHNWLSAGEHRVVIPFYPQVVEAITHAPVRFRRDITQLGSLIETSALLHQATREVDEDGRVVATLADYSLAREAILQSLNISAADAIEPRSVSILTYVHAELVRVDPEGKKPTRISSGRLAKALGIPDRTARYQLNKLIDAGYLANTEQLPKRPMRLRLGADFYPEMLGAGASVLPEAAELEKSLSMSSSSLPQTVAKLP
jgi:hypothetical protein